METKTEQKPQWITISKCECGHQEIEMFIKCKNCDRLRGVQGIDFKFADEDPFPESQLNKLIRQLSTAIECRIRCDVEPELDGELDKFLKGKDISHPYEFQTQMYAFFLKKLKECVTK